MKKLLSLILALVIAFSFAACGKKESEETVTDPVENEIVENEIAEEQEPAEEPEKETEEEAEKEPEKKPEKEPEKKPEEKPETKPQTKPNSGAQIGDVVNPDAKPQSKTVGATLLDEFKKMAKGSSSALSIAEALITNEIIAFMGGAMPVEEGFLTGFDDTEIKGFKEGAMFAPMIGTIPFVGYVFTLADGTKASDFIATLKGAANLRWNICTTADEMVTGSAGNKVFFVMCPENFEEE